MTEAVLEIVTEVRPVYLSHTEVQYLRDAYGSEFITRLTEARRDLEEAVKSVDDAMTQALLMAAPLNKEVAA